MNKQIWKYPIKVEDSQVIEIPNDFEILDIQLQNGYLSLWALVDVESTKEKVTIDIFGTGHTIDTKISRQYIKTIILNPTMVIHIFVRNLSKIRDNKINAIVNENISDN